jgi:galacturan 1,4-alpha-galacturonidase
MRFHLTTVLAIASATVAVASPTWAAFEQWAKGAGAKSAPEHTSPRPSISYHPHHPSKPPPSPPPRNRVCYVKSHNDGVTDDSKYILDALHDCNNGGHAVFAEGLKYTIGTALDLTFLNHIDIGKLNHRYLGYPLTEFYRYPIVHPVYKRHRVLAGKLLQIRLSERDHILQAWR